MLSDSALTSWRICSLECLGFSSNSVNLILTSQFIPQIHLPLTFLSTLVEITPRSPRLENLNPLHPARPQVLLTFPSTALESVNSLFFFHSQSLIASHKDDVFSLPTRFLYFLLQATPHSILQATSQIKFNFQLVFCMLTSFRDS